MKKVVSTGGKGDGWEHSGEFRVWAEKILDGSSGVEFFGVLPLRVRMTATATAKANSRFPSGMTTRKTRATANARGQEQNQILTVFQFTSNGELFQTPDFAGDRS
jgi:hypothetical protein